MRLSGRQNSIVLNLSLGSHHRVVLTIQDHSLSLHCLHTNNHCQETQSFQLIAKRPRKIWQPVAP